MSLFIDSNVIDLTDIETIDEAVNLAYNLHEDCLVLIEENNRLKEEIQCLKMDPEIKIML